VVALEKQLAEKESELEVSGRERQRDCARVSETDTKQTQTQQRKRARGRASEKVARGRAGRDGGVAEGDRFRVREPPPPQGCKPP